MSEPRDPQIPLSDEQLRALGMVTVRAADLDSVLEHAIWCLIPVGHGQGMAITTHMPTPLRVDVLLSLAETAKWGSTTLRDLKKLTNKIKRTLGKRHNLIHALWGPAADYDGATAFTRKARGKVEYSFEDKSAKEVEKIADELFEASSGLQDFLTECRVWPPP